MLEEGIDAYGTPMVWPKFTRRRFLAGVAASAAVAAMSARRGRGAPARHPVMTVNGEVTSDSLGIVLPHEHVMVDFGGARITGPHRYDADEVFDSVLPYLQEARNLGCGTLVECTPAYLARDPALLQRLSRASGLHILTNTGLYGASDDRYLPSYAFRETAEELAERWIREFRHGIQGTGIRPGFIKTAVDPHPSETDLKLVRAAALMHLATGLPIASHTGPASALKPQLAILAEEGVSPSAFIWVHAQAEPDASEILRAAAKGVWVELDGVTPETVEAHAALVMRLVRSGYMDWILLSHDAGWYSVGEEGGGTFRPYTALFTDLVPALEEAGLSKANLRRLLHLNPARAFALRRV